MPQEELGRFYYAVSPQGKQVLFVFMNVWKKAVVSSVVALPSLFRTFIRAWLAFVTL